MRVSVYTKYITNLQAKLTHRFELDKYTLCVILTVDREKFFLESGRHKAGGLFDHAKVKIQHSFEDIFKGVLEAVLEQALHSRDTAL